MSVLMCQLFMAPASNAFSWRDLWKNPDQQGAELLKHGKALEASKHFNDPNWKGVAYYRSGNYEGARDAWSQQETEHSLYNRSLAFARLGDIDAALADLDRVLAINPENKKAQENKKILENFKKEQKHQKGQAQEGHEGEKDQAKNTTQKSPKKNSGNKSQQSVKQQDVDNSTMPKPSDNANDPKANQPKPSPTRAEREREQAKEQTMRRIPDDPGGLLRSKFLRDYRRRHPL